MGRVIQDKAKRDEERRNLAEAVQKKEQADAEYKAKQDEAAVADAIHNATEVVEKKIRLAEKEMSDAQAEAADAQKRLAQTKEKAIDASVKKIKEEQTRGLLQVK